jgi:phosphohistidine phosphatase
MKTLYLVRHAKAEQPDISIRDFYRALTSQGMTDAARIARNMANNGVQPDHMISSLAERAMRTAETFADQLHFDSDKIMYDEDIYEGRMQEYLAVINAIDSTKNNVMLFGHNPIISFMAEYLTGEDIGDVPTSGVVTISFDNLNWNEVVKKSGKLIKFESPNTTLGF